MADASDSQKPKGRWKKITRRAFLITGITAAGGVAVGFGYLSQVGIGIPEDFSQGRQNGAAALNAWVRVEPDGTISVAVPRAEMGQGVRTALAMLVAEELGVELDQIKVEHPDVDAVYTNYAYAMGLEDSNLFEKDGHPLRWLISKVVATVPLIVTGGSTSVMDAWIPMRRAGASARFMLIEAAARKWSVAASNCNVQAGRVIHPDGEQGLDYADLARAAATIQPPSEVVLKPATAFGLIGKPVPRLDIPEKVTGKTQFGIDHRADDMLYAAVRNCPIKGGRITGYNADAIKLRRGIAGVVEVKGGIAVVADNTWRAFQAADALELIVDAGTGQALSTKSIEDSLQASLDKEPTHIFEEEGDLAKGFRETEKTIEADYAVPYLAHACMEPMNATVQVHGDGTAEAWAPTQSPTTAAWAVADGAGVSSSDVIIHVTYLGGGFGRRIEMDVIAQAAQIAKAFPGRPVKLTWSREQDIQNDFYRPMACARMKAGIDHHGKLVAWECRLASQSVEFEFGKRASFHLPSGAATKMNAAGAIRQPYSFKNCTVSHRWHRFPMPVGFWRSVGHSQNAFFTESFLDEVAHAAERDPYDFRRSLLQDSSRHLAVLDAVAEAANWGQELPKSRGRGIALHESFHSIVAQVVDVTVNDGELTVETVWCAVDCGIVINPDTVRAQLESGIMFGLSAALYGNITLENGEVVQKNFPDYQMVRLATAPKIETILVPNDGRPGGVGEVATPPIAPALVNAIFAATGKRLRRLPVELA